MQAQYFPKTRNTGTFPQQTHAVDPYTLPSHF